MLLIKEDGSGKPDANTYAYLEDCDAYHDAHLYATAWTAAVIFDKEKALLMATRLIDQEFQFNGFKATSTQALQWPRRRCPDPDAGTDAILLGGLIYSTPSVSPDLVPARIIQATCEMARELLIADRTGSPAGEGIAMQRNADLSEISYNKADRRPIISYVAQALLSKYGSLLSTSNGVFLTRV